MKKSVNNQHKSLEKISDMFSLPKDVVMSAMTVKIVGNGEIIVENYCTIAEYNSCNIKLLGKKSGLSVGGNNLTIVYFSCKNIIIRGCIKEVKFW